MKVIVAGSRTFSSYPLLKGTMDEFVQGYEYVTVLSGGATGADRLGEKWAKERGFEVMHFPALWSKWGKRAAYIRNYDMARSAHACVVFWDGQSRGSEMMIRIAKNEGLRLKVVRFGKE